MKSRCRKRRKQVAKEKDATAAQANSAKQWDDLYQTCEEMVKALVERLNRSDRWTVLFTTETECRISELQSSLAKIMLNDPNGRGRAANVQFWHITFNKTYQRACNCVSELSPDQLQRLRESVSKAIRRYRALMKAVAKLASDQVQRETLTGPVGLRWSPLAVTDGSHDQFALDVIHAAYIRLGDLARHQSALNPGTLHQGFWTSKRMYRCAMNLKPAVGSSISRLGAICADTKAYMNAAFYYMLSTHVDPSYKEGEQCLLYLLQEHGIWQTPNASNWLCIKDSFTSCSLRVLHYLYKPPLNWTPIYVERICRDNLLLIDGCLRNCCLCRNPGFDTGDFNASTVQALISLQIMLIKQLQQKCSPLLTVAVAWFLSIFTSMVVAAEDFVRICYDSAASEDVRNNTCRKATGSRSGHLEMEQPESSDSELANALNNQSGQAGKSVSTDVLTTVQKLRALERLRWLEVLKVMCDWLSLHPNVTHSMHANIWPRFISLLNALPNEAELIDLVNTADSPLPKEARELFSAPLSEWGQTVALPEDIDLYDVLPMQFKCDERVSLFDHLSTCFLRVCSLHSFGHYLISIRLPCIGYNSLFRTFTYPPDAEAVTASYDVLRRDCDWGVKALAGSVDPMPNIPVHLIPDPKHILIITTSTMKKLAHWRKAIEGASYAASWLEYELDHQNNYIYVHSSYQEHDKNKCQHLDIIDACCRLQTTVSSGKCNAAILTGNCEDVEEFCSFTKMASKLSNAMVRNVRDFYQEWFHSNLYKTYYKISDHSRENHTAPRTGCS
uniref:EST1_DNA_bind domain-containing protein n=1 Tax=Trichuris muris TaxID=70415 RepID=A0A5S6Q6J7_TRIMR